jgi:HSP20 family molecular chaperone IbpA
MLLDANRRGAVPDLDPGALIMSMENRSIPVAFGRPTGEAAAHAHVHAHQAAGAEEMTPVQHAITPLIDIHEGADGLILEADLPGVVENSVTIQLEDNVLVLHAKVPSPFSEGARVLHEEYRVDDFYRSFILSDEVERGRITAELKNGVLRLILPKAERAKTRRIEIKS